MDCYKDLSASREALFAIGSVRFLPSFLAAALISNWRRCRSSLSRVFSAYHTERSNPHIMKLIDLNRVALTGLLVCALSAFSAYGQQGANNVEQRVNNILNQMTLDEKLSYIGGTGFWDIKPIPRLGLPQIFMENGPLGIAHQPFEPTTRYPAGLAAAATWNRDRARGRGRQIGQDARARGFYADLGPGIDFYRTPLGGRDFEYNTGEDPYLGSQLVVPLVDAMQQQGVWANVKHFVCNDEEYRRENIDIEVKERALRENLSSSV